MPRVLLLLPTTTYRAGDFLEAAKGLGVEVVVASERPNVFQEAQPGRYLSLDFFNPDKAARQAIDFAATRPSRISSALIPVTQGRSRAWATRMPT